MMRGSTMVVRSAVNRDVVGSSPTRAANKQQERRLGNLLAVQCKECKDILYKQDFVPSVGEQRFATCDCGNVQMGTKAMEGSFIPWYVTVHFRDSKPDIFQTEERKTIDK